MIERQRKKTLLLMNFSATPTNRFLVYLLIMFFFWHELMPKAEKHRGSIAFEDASCFAADTGRVGNKKPQRIADI